MQQRWKSSTVNLRSTLQTKMKVRFPGLSGIVQLLHSVFKACFPYHARYSTPTVACQGKEPWNKGRQMTDETRQKMRAAKLGRRHTTATRARMSHSHTGLLQTEVCIKVPAQLLSSSARLPAPAGPHLPAVWDHPPFSIAQSHTFAQACQTRCGGGVQSQQVSGGHCGCCCAGKGSPALQQACRQAQVAATP